MKVALVTLGLASSQPLSTQAWVAHVRASEFKQFLEIDAAIEAFRLASEAATEKIWKLALAVVFAFPAVMLDAAKIHY